MVQKMGVKKRIKRQKSAGLPKTFGGKIMTRKMKTALRENVQDLVNAGIKTTFTQKQLKSLGIKIPKTDMNSRNIKKIRKALNLSQPVFAQLLNVSLASVRHWEQGLREPTGSTKVLLELLGKEPHVLDYRILARKAA